MATYNVTLSNLVWTRITNPGQSGTTWKKSGQHVVVAQNDQDIDDTLPLSSINVTVAESHRIPLDKDSGEVLQLTADDANTVFYALVIGDDTAEIVCDSEVLVLFGLPFIFEIKTTVPGETFTDPLELTGTYDFYQKHGDGKISHITAYNQLEVTHTYASAGTHVNKIYKTITGWKFNNSASAPKVYEVSSWGSLKFLPASGYQFDGCVNMTWIGDAVGGMDTTGVTNMRSFFDTCRAFNSSIANIDTSSATSIHSMFNSCSLFNQSVAHFDTSNVLTMFRLFRSCLVFNQSVSNFDTSKVTTMLAMFQNANAFNQSVSNFDTSKVTTMNSMFFRCFPFDQDVSNFDISLVTNMTTFLYEVTLSTANYDALIIAFSADAQSIVAAFHGGNSKYTAGGAVEAARNVWIAKGWVLTDGGPA